MSKCTAWFRIATVFALWMALASPVLAQEADDAPRLFITPERLAELRTQMRSPRSPAAEMVQGMKTRIKQGWEAGYRAGFRPGRRTYQSSWMAREAAMMYLLTEDKQYVDIALRELREGVKNAGTTGRGLNDAQHSVAFAMVYDWCKPAMSEADRTWMEAEIDEALDHWPSVSHANFGMDRGSNWVSVCRGGELILLLASGQAEQRADRLEMLKRELGRHINSAIGSIGYTQEGVGYASFGGAFLQPAALALESVLGDDTLVRELQRRRAWVFPMFAGSTGAGDENGWQRFLMSGVSGALFMDEGWASALLGIVPDEDMPYYLYFYDRHAGPENERDVEVRYDSTRGGTVFAALYYPFDVESKDPLTKYAPLAADERGYYFFRNQWQDHTDVITSIMADTSSHRRAWDQPEALQIALLAYDTTFIGGPARDRDPHRYSAPLINGERGSGNPQHHRGRKVHEEATEHGGYVIVAGGEVYNGQPVKEVTRHYLVDFSEATGTDALLTTLDRFEADRDNTYTWNAAIGDHAGADGVERVEVSSQNGRPAFTMHGRHNSFVRGWVVHPADARIENQGDDALQIHAEGQDVDIWVVMVVGAGEPPQARITGEGMDAAIRIGGQTLRFDGERLVQE
ncbi:MAG: hypothetical protein WD534_02440 [Phycisphaeraceae bacterium]